MEYLFKGGRLPMHPYLIQLDPVAARFYERIASCAQRSVEEVLQDALFKLAGELSMEVLSKES